MSQQQQQWQASLDTAFWIIPPLGLHLLMAGAVPPPAFPQEAHQILGPGSMCPHSPLASQGLQHYLEGRGESVAPHGGREVLCVEEASGVDMDQG